MYRPSNAVFNEEKERKSFDISQTLQQATTSTHDHGYQKRFKRASQELQLGEVDESTVKYNASETMEDDSSNEPATLNGLPGRGGRK